ncbi:hypothetical protein AB0K09_15725 [Streptomyces sp. NPDC049577]|uniref:hypothetical protein n=1 Tax=Streptomyces sp. NPDC049577 TaxID=3155153 RepID=UPI003440D249
MTSHAIQAGQVYRRVDTGRRIRITSYRPGAAKADIVDHTSGETLDRVPVRQLHDGAFTPTGRLRRAGYVLDPVATRHTQQHDERAQDPITPQQAPQEPQTGAQAPLAPSVAPGVDAATTRPADGPTADHAPPRTFVLLRAAGRIAADGVLWPDGSASIRWRGPYPSADFWDHGINDLTGPGHADGTRIIWTDTSPDTPRTPLTTAPASTTATSADTTWTRPDTDDTALRNALLVLLSKASRGTLTPADGRLLEQHVEHLLRDRVQLAAALRRTAAHEPLDDIGT